MSRDSFGFPVAEGWTIVANVQGITPDGKQVSLSSHQVNGLDNETTDAGIEALMEKVKDQVHEWQDLKKKGYPKG